MPSPAIYQHRFPATAFLVAAAAFSIPSIPAQAGPGATPASVADNADIQALISAASVAPSAGACNPGGCPQFSCPAAIVLSSAFDDAFNTLSVVAPALAAYRVAYQKDLASIDANWQTAIDDAQKRQNALIVSQALSQVGTLVLEVASISESYTTLSNIVEQGSTETWNSNAAITSVINALNNVQATTVGAVSGANAIGQLARQNSFMDNAVGTSAEIGSGLSEVASGIATVQLQAKAWQAAKAADDAKAIAEAGKALKESWTSFAGGAGKILNQIAESEQEELREEILEDYENAQALDKNFSDVYLQYVILGDRQVLIKQATDAIRDAMENTFACTVQCPNAQPLPPAPDANRMSYGEVLQKYNNQFAPIASRIKAAGSLSITSSKPTIAVTPNLLSPGDRATAHYSLASCPATVGAQIRWRDARSLAGPIVGAAQQTADASVSFTGPSDDGNYEGTIEDAHRRTLATGPFTVTPLQCGVTLPSMNGSADTVAKGHLPAQTLPFTIGTPNQAGYETGSLGVMPGLFCGDGTVHINFFGGVSRIPEYFTTKIDQTVPPVGELYAEQWPRAARITFDVGGTVSANVIDGSDYQILIPGGAKRMTRIDVDFSVPGALAPTTLTWSAN
ncbi:MAG TPA: hypothetical protein VLX85_03365 [Stellaceae bacterium]|nr:hypothetical protein [Stellaceae bacterium]